MSIDHETAVQFQRGESVYGYLSIQSVLNHPAVLELREHLDSGRPFTDRPDYSVLSEVVCWYEPVYRGRDSTDALAMEVGQVLTWDHMTPENDFYTTRDNPRNPRTGETPEESIERCRRTSYLHLAMYLDAELAQRCRDGCPPDVVADYATNVAISLTPVEVLTEEVENVRCAVSCVAMTGTAVRLRFRNEDVEGDIAPVYISRDVLAAVLPFVDC